MKKDLQHHLPEHKENSAKPQAPNVNTIELWAKTRNAQYEYSGSFIFPLYVHISRHQFPSKKVAFSFPYRNMHEHRYIMDLKNKTSSFANSYLRHSVDSPKVCVCSNIMWRSIIKVLNVRH